MNAVCTQPSRKRPRPSAGTALVELIGGMALLGMAFTIFVSTLHQIHRIDAHTLAANRGQIVLHNTLERVESETPVSTGRLTRILEQEFSASELAVGGRYRTQVREQGGLVFIEVLDAGNTRLVSLRLNL